MSDRSEAERAYYNHRIGTPSCRDCDECDECDRLWREVVKAWQAEWRNRAEPYSASAATISENKETE